MKTKKISPKDYEKIGKLIVDIGESGELNRKKLYKTAFIKGIFSGVGGVIGATIIIAFIIWLLTLFDDLLIIGPIAEAVLRALESQPK